MSEWVGRLTLGQACGRALEWRVVALALDFVVVFGMTGRVALSAGVASVSALVKTVAHGLWIYQRGHHS